MRTKINFDIESLDSMLQNKKYSIVSHTPHAVAQGLLHNNEYEMAPVVVQIEGIIPEQETTTTQLEKTILHQKTINECIQNKQILIGKKTLRSLHVIPGETVTLLYSEESEVSNVKFKEIDLIVGGVFETGIDEYDSSLAYCSFDLFNQLFPEHGISQVYVKLNTTKDNEVKKLLKKDLQVDAYSWKDLYPTIVSAIQLESMGMFIILFLIILIATINIMSVLFMYIHQKQKNIALFSCMGISKKEN